jgi:hypothetical protein
MSDSSLSFGNSSVFRKQLLVKNLAPYSVAGAYASRPTPVDYETNLTVSSVVNSPDNYVSTNLFANDLYPLNEYGPEGGFGGPIGLNSVASTNNPEGTNQGPYAPQDTQLDIINEFFIESAYVTNKFGPSGGYKDLVIITDIIGNQNIYQPYWDPGYYNYSSYSTYSIVFQDDPIGSNGLLSSDTYLAKIGATQLKFAFNERIAQEIAQSTVGVINLDTISDPFSASLLATGQQPFFIRNWKITVPENPVLAAVSLANRLTGTYFPVSFIPGNYFIENTPINAAQTIAALGVPNALTGGLLAPILNKYRNPSEIFVANTGNGQRSALFSALDYNIYRPSYNRGVIGGLIAGASAAVDRLFNQDSSQSGGYYVGSKDAEPSQIDGPANQVPVNAFGEQLQSIVYGPQELGILYEGNEETIKFGLKGRSYSDGGGTAGQLVWTSPKYKDNAGFHATVGGGVGSLDGEFNEITADYTQYQSTNIPFKPGSILANTQALINSADQVQGQARLKHVGTAINQVSKVFNDGYKEITKGSQVLSYVNQADGTQAGIEYCRIFQKDTPYYTYADLQKSAGITKEGRRADYSILDNTYNLNIAPLKNPGSTNIVDGKVKKYMFSIENLAWRTSDRPGFTYDELPVCEKGPNGGRIMWFPPYNLKFSDDSKPDFNPTTFLGRPEPIYTYKNTTRSGSLSWTIIVDNPSVMNTIIEKQMKGAGKERVQSIVDSFFAGCTKYDLYDLAAKFNTIPAKDLYTYQQILNNPRLTVEEQQIVFESIPQNAEGGVGTQTGNATGGDGTVNTGNNGTVKAEDPVPPDWNKFEGLGFYFDNDIPGTNPNTTAAQPFNVYYNTYIGQKSVYQQKAPQKVENAGTIYSGSSVPNFFTDVVEGNFNVIQNELLKQIDDVLVKSKGSITIDLIGSASSPQEVAYNKLLSQRRNNSVEKWFLNQVLSDKKTILQYKTEGKFKITLDSNGEQIVIPKNQKSPLTTASTVNDISVNNTNNGTVLNADLDCSVTTKELNAAGQPIAVNPKEKPNNAQVYSIPAMGCRRVAIKNIDAVIPIDPVTTDTTTKKTTTTETPPSPVNVLTATTQSIKPEAKLTVEQKIKEGISKKILRNLFSECDYFEVIKETNPMVYDTIKDKIRFFNPAFHSMTPEGLNARLTFLNQCTRPGQTIPVIGPDGRPKYNDALNTSFGAPPILVLRVGDFYHCKIVPTSVGFNYDNSPLDLNPEGIGVQPMICNVTMAFNIIGGMGLKEPVQQLQNALSFNYYANTEIYDERAVATEDTSKLDQYVVEKINGALPIVNTAQAAVINSVQPKKGQNTIGIIVDPTTIDYGPLLTSLQDKLVEYFTAYTDMLNKLTTDYNYGVLQLASKNRVYSKGVLSEYVTPLDIEIYGKSNNYLQYTEDLIVKVKKDIDSGDTPLLVLLKSDQLTNKQTRELKDKLTTNATNRQDAILSVIQNATQNFINIQQGLDYIFRQMDMVVYQTDGVLQDTNEPTVYQLSGDTFFAPVTTPGSIKNVYLGSVAKTIKDFNKDVNDLVKLDLYQKKTSTIEDGDGCKFSINGEPSFSNCEENRFYIAFSPLFTKEDNFTLFVNDLISGPDIKNDTKIVEAIKKACNSLKDKYLKLMPFLVKRIDELKNNATTKAYENAVKYKLPDTTVKTCNYITPPTDDVDQRTKRIKDLYSSKNLNNNDTFNGKVTFN